MKQVEQLIEYKHQIEELSIDRIKPNDLNPRERFNEEEEDELIQSILAKGILNPIVVFKRNSDNQYIILDGERRYRACKKLNINKIPARILEREPDKLETLSLMFHLHNVKEDWTEFAISITLKRIIDEMGKDIWNLSREDKKELTKITSLSEYKIMKYIKFQLYPEEVIQRFFDSEIHGKKEKGADPDILLEMYRPIEEIKKHFPDVLKKYPVSKIIDACIKKKSKNVIKANKEFRLIVKSFKAVDSQKLRPEILRDQIVSFITDINVSAESIYKATSETIYLYKAILKTIGNLYQELNNIDLSDLTKDEKHEITKQINLLIKLFKSRF